MKPRIYLLPGTMCTEAVWAPVAGRLAGCCDAVPVPVPAAPDLSATIDALAAAIAEDGALVAGFSLGGYLAAELMARVPGRISRLMLVASTPCPLIAAELKQREAAIDWVRTHGYKGVSRTRARQLAGNVPDPDRIVDTVLAMDAALGEAVFVHQMRVTTERRDLAPALAGFAAQGGRLALVAAQTDPLIDHDWLARFEAKVPAASIHRLAGDSHLLPLTHADALAESMAHWAGV